jgi:hypothetical protein
MNLRDVCIIEVLKDLKLSVGRRPEKPRLFMLQVSLGSLGSFVLERMTVGICWSRVYRMLLVMEVGMRMSGMFVVHLVCLLGTSRRP